MSSEFFQTKDVSVRALPRFILRKDKMTNLIIKPSSSRGDMLNKIKTIQPLYKDMPIYESTPGDFMKIVDKKLTIVNRLNLLTKSSLTIARYWEKGRCEEHTSENITNLIGPENYDLVFSTLCSVINQEFKIRGILALLSVPKKTEFKQKSSPIVSVDIETQTEESSFDVMIKTRPRRRVKRQQPTPYVVTDKPEKLNRVVIDPSEFKNFSAFSDFKTEPTNFKSEPFHFKSELITSTETQLDPSSEETTPELPLLKTVDLDEDSKDSIGGFSVETTPELLKAPLSLLNNVDKVTEKVQGPDWGNKTNIVMLDGTVITLPVKPEDDFHIATPEILRYVEPENRRKLLGYQMFMDLKLCLKRNEEGYLALHAAVVNDDVDLVRRQCVILKSKDESVDIPTEDNQTALQLSIMRGSPACTAILLRAGADPLVADEEYRTCLHLAAEAPAGHLRELVGHCAREPLKILQDNEDLWKPELASKPVEYLTSYLLHEICSRPDNQGETPLMVASRLGRHENVRLLVEAAPRTVNAKMSNCGITPLFRAVGSACHDATNRGNKSKISDDFKRTIEILVENGADPTIANDSGHDVNTLLTDSNVGELSLLIAGKLTYMNTRDTNSRSTEPLMLIKEEDGTVNVADHNINKRTARGKQKTIRVTNKTNKNSGDDVKNVGKDIKITDDVKNVNSLKNTAIIKKSEKNIAIIMKAAIESTDKNITMMDSKEQRGGKIGNNNTAVQIAGTSEMKKNSNITKFNTNDSKKLVIIDDKVVSASTQNSNQYLHHFKKFVDSQRLKRKAEDSVKSSPNVLNTPATHPRVKTLKKNSVSLPKIDLNTVRTVVSDSNKAMILELSPAKKVRGGGNKIVVIDNKPSGSKVHK